MLVLTLIFFYSSPSVDIRDESQLAGCKGIQRSNLCVNVELTPNSCITTLTVFSQKRLQCSALTEGENEINERKN
jgi:hypothetical protein